MKKQSTNQSHNKSKYTPQTSRYSISGMDKYFKFKQSQITQAELTDQQKHIKKVKSLKNLKSCNNGSQNLKHKKPIRGPSPIVNTKMPQKPQHFNMGIGKQLQVKPLSNRESTRYPSQTSISTSTSTKNHVIKPIVTRHQLESPDLLKKISSYYK